MEISPLEFARIGTAVTAYVKWALNKERRDIGKDLDKGFQSPSNSGHLAFLEASTYDISISRLMSYEASTYDISLEMGYGVKKFPSMLSCFQSVGCQSFTNAGGKKKIHQLLDIIYGSFIGAIHLWRPY